MTQQATEFAALTPQKSQKSLSMAPPQTLPERPDYSDTIGPEVQSIAARLLSCGAGIQTTAMVIRYIEQYDFVVFSDTGAEWPETYAYIKDYLKPHCGHKWVTVQAKETLEAHALRRHVIPMRSERWCTDKFKVRAIRKFIKTEIKPTPRKYRPVIVDIGFSTDEITRLGRGDTRLYERRRYPLLNDGLSRKDCVDIIKAHGWPVPPKSGCWFCPYQSPAKYQQLKQQHPDLFNRAIALEKNGMKYPKHTLIQGTPLITIKQNQTLDDHIKIQDDMCGRGYCMT